MGLEGLRVVKPVGAIPISPDVIFYDDMEGQLNWRGAGTGADWVVDRFGAVGAQVMGNYGLRMMTRATTPAVGDSVTAFRDVSLRQQKKVYLGFFFRLPTIGTISRFAFFTYCYTGSVIRCVEFLYNRVTGRWEYYAPGPTLTPVPGGSQAINSEAWNWFEVGLDYGRPGIFFLECAGLRLENLDLVTYSIGNPEPPRLHIAINMVSSAASQQTAYLDLILLREIT